MNMHFINIGMPHTTTQNEPSKTPAIYKSVISVLFIDPNMYIQLDKTNHTKTIYVILGLGIVSIVSFTLSIMMQFDICEVQTRNIVKVITLVITPITMKFRDLFADIIKHEQELIEAGQKADRLLEAIYKKDNDKLDKANQRTEDVIKEAALMVVEANERADIKIKEAALMVVEANERADIKIKESALMVVEANQRADNKIKEANQRADNKIKEANDNIKEQLRLMRIEMNHILSISRQHTQPSDDISKMIKVFDAYTFDKEQTDKYGDEQ